MRISDRDAPIVRSLRNTDVSKLVLVNVNLEWCMFADARRLDQLRFEGHCRFRNPPNSWRWSPRRVLIEECGVRRWPIESPNDPSKFLPPHPGETPERTATLYRSLRKAFEDSKNEAGAGDFYYGEMEMRRRSLATSRAERWILSSYWLLSGYGQRAGRALTAIGVLVVAVSVLLLTVGLPGEHVWTWVQVDQSARIAMGAVVFRDAGQQLTPAGTWTVMIARFLGPVLLALAVLAVRTRVKR